MHGVLDKKEEAAFYNYFSQEEADKLGIAPGYYLKPEFVRGVYDADKQTFIKNENYYENLSEKEQDALFAEVKKKYIELLKGSQWTLEEYANILTRLGWENPLTPEESIQADREVSEINELESQIENIDKSAQEGKAEGYTKESQQDNGRMQFVQRFLDLYDNTETEYQQETRLELESGSIQRVLDIVGKKDMQISDLIDVRYIDIDETGEKIPEYTAKQFSAMARLLKAAEGLNNDKDVNPDGVNYLEQFTAVPQIKNILLAMSQDFKYEGTYLHQLRDEYKKSKSVGDMSDPSTLEEVSDNETTVSHKLNKTMGTTYEQRAEQQTKTSSQRFRESVAHDNTKQVINEESEQQTKTPSQRFRDVVSKDTTKQGISGESQQQTKTSSQSFREFLDKSRSTKKTGITDIKKSQKDIGLRTERGNLIRQSLQGQLDEDGKRRLEEINRLLNIKNVNVQQFEANKRRQGQSR